MQCRRRKFAPGVVCTVLRRGPNGTFWPSWTLVGALKTGTPDKHKAPPPVPQTLLGHTAQTMWRETPFHRNPLVYFLPTTLHFCKVDSFPEQSERIETLAGSWAVVDVNRARCPAALTHDAAPRHTITESFSAATSTKAAQLNCVQLFSRHACCAQFVAQQSKHCL